MKSCVVHIATNSGFSDESIACGLIHINEDGSYLFRWSEEKLDIAVKLIGKNSILDFRDFRGDTAHPD